MKTDGSFLRPELKPLLPRRMVELPVHRGYSVPWFVAELADGSPEFRCMDARRWTAAVKQRRCWVCGAKLGSYLAFVIGPMCGITRTSGEPPNHLECAEFSVRACPFLSRPHMARREDGLPEDYATPGGFAILRNPGVSLIWVTKSYTLFDDGEGKPLIRVGDPVHVGFYAEGREATSEEVRHSIDTGLPLLMEKAELDGPEGVVDLKQRVEEFEALL
jgi:hypothetical protein